MVGMKLQFGEKTSIWLASSLLVFEEQLLPLPSEFWPWGWF